MSQTTGSQCPFSIMAQGITDRPQRIGTLVYGLAAYALFFVTLLYAVAWVGGWLVAKTINSGEAGPPVPSLLFNTLLLSLFVVQHTVMARPAFKRWWVRIIPHAIERSTFVIAASLSLLAVFLLWRPVPATVWRVADPVPAAAITGLSLAGWGLVLFSSFVINHFDLFGLRQVWLRYTGRPQTPVGFRLAGPYKLVRHPLMVGFLIAFWATPHMTVGHLFFAVMTTGYIFMGIWFEERDLIAEHGEAYLRYRRGVRALLPIPRGAPGGQSVSTDER